MGWGGSALRVVALSLPLALSTVGSTHAGEGSLGLPRDGGTAAAGLQGGDGKPAAPTALCVGVRVSELALALES